MRWADFGPTPGRQRSAWMSSSRAAGLSNSESGDVHSRREIESRREARHLGLRGRFRLRHRVVERGHDEILEHVLVLAEESGIDRYLARLELAGDRDFHETRAGLALDLDLR